MCASAWNGYVCCCFLSPLIDPFKQHQQHQQDNIYQNAKYVLSRMIEGDEEWMSRLRPCSSMSAVCDFVKLSEFYRDFVADKKAKVDHGNLTLNRKRKVEGHEGEEEDGERKRCRVGNDREREKEKEKENEKEAE